MRDWPGRASEDVPSPALVAAWFVLDVLPSERIPYFAAFWLVEGYDGPRVVHLAGLSGDDAHDVRDVLEDALADCGVVLPSTAVAAATVAFTAIARMQLDGRASERWVVDKVVEIVARNDYSSDVTDLPLGGLWGLDDEWDAGWGRTTAELEARVRELCLEQAASADGDRSTEE